MCDFTMFKCFVCCFIIFISQAISCCAFTCIYDKINPKTSLFARSLKYQDIRDQRDKDPALFEPLEIFFYLDSFDPTLSQNVISNIEVSLTHLREFIAQTFQVRKRSRPFLLQRSGCTRKWQSGVNKGRCSAYKNGAEICEAGEISYEISGRFLDQIDVYEFETREPKTKAPAGPGLLSSNFIQFVTSQSSIFCEDTDVFAYATHCKLDEKTNEPLAGILNLCPNYLKKKIYTSQHYYNIILHELFHVLGFSSKMFEKYLPCQKGIHCDVPKSVIQADFAGNFRMMYPRVIENMQSHFNCSNTDFGAPMDTVFATDIAKETTAEGYTSHWHPVLMYSSIMTPKFNEFDDIFVDNITLAAFASTGWYRVNFTNVQKFIFGKDQGCVFGMNDTCNAPYLCNVSVENIGCDIMHNTIGVCTSLTPHHKCGIYLPHSRENCQSHSERSFGLDFYAMDYQQRCLMIQESNGSTTPSCLPIKCNASSSYDIFINSTWYSCASENELTMEESLTIKCPDFEMFCPSSSKTFRTFSAVDYTFCPKDPPFIVLIKLRFQLPLLKELGRHRSFKNFKVTVIRKIAEKMGIPVNYIVLTSVNVFKKVYMDLAICPPNSVGESELINVVKQAQKFLDGGSFYEILKGYNDLIISSTDIKIDPDYNIAFSDYEGFRTLIAFPVLSSIFLIVTSTASIVRMLLLRKDKPRRTEHPSENQISQTTKSS